MTAHSLIDRARPEGLQGTFLGKVTSVKDDQHLARVQVRLLSVPADVSDADASVWARVAVPFAGDNRGAFMLPDVGDEVLVTFVHGDVRAPVIVGSLWSGSAKPTETLGGDGSRVDRWSLVGKRGSRIGIVEETDGQANIHVSTPGGVSVELDESSGGSIQLKAGGSSISIDSGGITLTVGGTTMKVEADEVTITCSQITASCAVSQFEGLMVTDTIQTTTILASTYTPGAGNVW